MSIGCSLCCKGCNCSRLRNGFAFAPPTPSYTVDDNKIIYVEERHRYHPDFQAAADVGLVEFLTVASGDQVPVVWLKYDHVRAWCDPDSSQSARSTTLPSSTSSAPPSETISVASDSALGITTNEKLAEVDGDMLEIREPDYPPYLASSITFPQQYGRSDDWDLEFLERAPEPKNDGRSLSSAKRRSASQRRVKMCGVLTPREPHKTSAKPSLGCERPFLVIFFHSNATDIGQMMSDYLEISRNVCVDVLGVEYSGYGAASGHPSPAIVMQAADAAYNYAIKSGMPPSRILLYGQSLGSGPALQLAKRQPVAGVILHSPFLSGIQVLDRSPECCCKPSCVFACWDFFRNDYAVRSVGCPVFIMHGQDDVFVPVWHGVRLRDRLTENSAWPAYFPEEACHDDLIDVDPETYYAKLRAFVKSMKEGQVVRLREDLGEQMATSEGQLPAQRPARVAMVSVRSGGMTRVTRHMQTQRSTQPGSVAGRRRTPRGHIVSPGTAADCRSKSADPFVETLVREENGGEMATSEGPRARRPAQMAMVSVRSGRITRDHRHLPAQGPTKPGSVAGRRMSSGTPRGQSVSPGTAADRRSKSADPFVVTLVREETGGEMATSEGPRPAQRPAQVAMVSVRSGDITRDDRHMQTQRPTQLGSVTGRRKSPGTPRGRVVSPSTAADRNSKSADPLEVALARMSQVMPPCSPENSPPPLLPRAVKTSLAPPRPPRTAEASPGGAGVSKMTFAITEAKSQMISNRYV